MFKIIPAKIRAFVAFVPLALVAILLALAPAAYADGHHDNEGPFWFDKVGWTQLHFLAYLNYDKDPVADLARAQDLLSRGANPNVGNEFDNTPLMFAASTNFIKMASLLIANGAFVNARNIWGNTALDEAIEDNQTQMQALLRAHGGKCNKWC